VDAESIVELLADAILLFFSSAEIDGLLSRIEGRRLGGLDVGVLMGYLLLLVWDDGMVVGLLLFAIDDGLLMLLVVGRLLFGEVLLLMDRLLGVSVMLMSGDGLVG
jgi:hypothetical protein